MLSVFYVEVTNKSIMLHAIMLSVVMLNVIMLNVVAPSSIKCQISNCIVYNCMKICLASGSIEANWIETRSCLNRIL
jgi:hypothetical protein